MNNPLSFDLKNKAALVTGGARGLGQAMAAALAAVGADVVIADMVLDQAEDAASKIEKETSVSCLAVRADISVENDVEQMVQRALERFGKIDILVNNAGIHIGGEFAPEALDRKYWDKTLAVNLTGAFLCCQTVGKHMIERKKGKIVNIASMSGMVVNRLTGKHNPAYCVSKAGVIMLTKVLAAEWAKYNICVNAIAPTYIETDMCNKAPGLQAEMRRDIPMGRIGRPDDLAGAVVYLASAASDFVTGHTLLLDGGYTAW
jgi:NAD(P)-dependent dehydrogenase (short-subunit alcohol dehydrogenase family)